MAGSGSSNRAHEFLRAVTGFSEANSASNVENRPIRLGTVDYDYDPGDFLGGIYPRIMFDGEKVVSQKRYQTMVGYYPLPGQRVVLVPVGTTYLIIGTVSLAPQDPKVDIYTTVGADTWEKPQGARVIVVECQGGGGAGGGAAVTSSTQVSAGAGGCGGAYAKSTMFANSVAASVTVTVGALGAGVSGTTGGTGGASSFGTMVTADGGLGGGTGTSTTPGANNGAPGFAQVPVGDIAIPGQGGGAGIRMGSGVGTAVSVAITGMGGSSVLGGGSRGLGTTTVTVPSGAVGMGYGAGGGGSGNGVSQAAALAGGDGSQGVVIVTTYF
jgi:hypothetical protein